MTDDTVSVYWHDRMLDHEPPAGTFKFPSMPIIAHEETHPDRRERIENIRAMLGHSFPEVTSYESPERATRSEIERVHEPDYVDWLEAFCADGGGRIEDTTTGANEATFDASRVAAGAAIDAVREALEGERTVPYALCRPSGHHARPACADGFCFLNNAAIAAEEALTHGIDRVAIVDWDVHHGNGTQEAFYDRDDVLFVSAHADHGSWHPEYHPQEGSLEEVGAGVGEGYTVNVPLPPGTGDRGYDALFERIVDPVVREYNPDLVLVSAGQDAGAADPNARNLVTRDGFFELGRHVRRLADECADGRLVFVQEGGYQPSHLSFATLDVFEGVLDRRVDLARFGLDDPFARFDEPTELVDAWLADAIEHHRTYWNLE
ncbi:class II histone deacetylase [Halalkalicoccus sp. NIPERK01]|uniref:class II histone deacetylase n=1 Tax=Halalkalicoccus sp. NIPERK01 TaxID=3053469 RepID=UPI00256ED930|nr:class II histone deacetylase [Halalkalicoccus sp. NIPERK01]MDL5363329.1 class II histone deacetylase [Halalkalicoccus sp. NIPERK01]